MNPKFNITTLIAKILNLPCDEKNIKKYTRVWWVNPRDKRTGGLQLTEKGFEVFQKSNIKHYEIVLESPIIYTNSMIVWLDNKIDCPYFLTNKKIFVFGEKTAVQLLLFSGDLNKMKRAQDRFQQKVLDNSLR
jgi:hypothetical protein